MNRVLGLRRHPRLRSPHVRPQSVLVLPSQVDVVRGAQDLPLAAVSEHGRARGHQAQARRGARAAPAAAATDHAAAARCAVQQVVLRHRN